MLHGCRNFRFCDLADKWLLMSLNAFHYTMLIKKYSKKTDYTRRTDNSNPIISLATNPVHAWLFIRWGNWRRGVLSKRPLTESSKMLIQSWTNRQKLNYESFQRCFEYLIYDVNTLWLIMMENKNDFHVHNVLMKNSWWIQYCKAFDSHIPLNEK